MQHKPGENKYGVEQKEQDKHPNIKPPKNWD